MPHPHHCLQGGELELETERAKHSETQPAASKADVASHSETLRDTAPVLEGVKVTPLNVQQEKSVDSKMLDLYFYI